MSPEDKVLIREYTRSRKTKTAAIVEVAVIDWPTPSEPTTTWVLVTELPLSSSVSAIEDARIAILQDRRYFQNKPGQPYRERSREFSGSFIGLGAANAESGGLLVETDRLLARPAYPSHGESGRSANRDFLGYWGELARTE